MYADAPPDLLNTLIDKRVDGIAVAGVGNGNLMARMDAGAQ